MTRPGPPGGGTVGSVARGRRGGEPWHPGSPVPGVLGRQARRVGGRGTCLLRAPRL